MSPNSANGNYFVGSMCAEDAENDVLNVSPKPLVGRGSEMMGLSILLTDRTRRFIIEGNPKVGKIKLQQSQRSAV